MKDKFKLCFTYTHSLHLNPTRYTSVFFRCGDEGPIAQCTVALPTDNNMRRGSGGRASSLSGGLGASAPKQLVLPHRNVNGQGVWRMGMNDKSTSLPDTAGRQTCPYCFSDYSKRMKDEGCSRRVRGAPKDESKLWSGDKPSN
jgi:hypothetical protein